MGVRGAERERQSQADFPCGAPSRTLRSPPEPIPRVGRHPGAPGVTSDWIPHCCLHPRFPSSPAGSPISANGAMIFPKGTVPAFSASLIPRPLQSYLTLNSLAKPGDFHLKHTPQIRPRSLPYLTSIGALLCSWRKIQAPDSGSKGRWDQGPLYSFQYTSHCVVLPCQAPTIRLCLFVPTQGPGPMHHISCADMSFP